MKCCFPVRNTLPSKKKQLNKGNIQAIKTRLTLIVIFFKNATYIHAICIEGQL